MLVFSDIMMFYSYIESRFEESKNIFTGLEGRKRKAAGLDAKINMIDCATGSLVQGKYVYSILRKCRECQYQSENYKAETRNTQFL